MSAYTPSVASIGGGIAIQLNPTVDRDSQTAVVTLYSTFNDPDKPGKPIAIRSSFAATQSAAGKQDGQASGTYRPLNGIVQELSTTTKLPLDVPVLIGAMTLEPTAKDVAAKELALILTIYLAE